MSYYPMLGTQQSPQLRRFRVSGTKSWLSLACGTQDDSKIFILSLSLSNGCASSTDSLSEALKGSLAT
jgi:hypothetical protein